jgi:predicted peptidase
MGGFGVWDWIVRRPDLFWKALPMSAGGDITQAAHLIHTPVWAFHGDHDDVVGVGHSRAMIQAIRRAGGSPRYTEIPGAGHGPWSDIIVRSDVLAWLFQN